MKIFSTISKKIVLCLVCIIFFASCNLPGGGSGTGSSLVWLDQATTNSLLPLAPFTLKAHARGSVTRIEFLVNDMPVGSVNTDASLLIAYAEISWNPSAIGSYTIRARSFAGNGSNISEIAYVCVSDTVSATSAGFGGDCASPVAGAGEGITGTPASVDPITIIANINDNPLYYGDCDPHTLTVKANLSGDLSALDAVRVSWVYDTATGTSAFGLGDVPFDHNEMTRQSDGTYLWSTDLNTAATGWGLAGDPYVINVYVEAWDSSTHGLGITGPLSTGWQSCSAGAVITPTSATLPVPIVITSTFTTVPVPVVSTPTFTSVPAPVDTTPPGITITNINPADVGYYITGCGPNSISVQANVTDASGISNVSLTYQYSNGTSSNLSMTSMGGGNYQAVLPLDMNTYNALLGVNGTVFFTVNATDTQGNAGSSSGGPVTLLYCPG